MGIDWESETVGNTEHILDLPIFWRLFDDCLVNLLELVQLTEPSIGYLSITYWLYHL